MDPNSGNRKLVNKLSPQELQHRLELETFKRKTLSFYRYVIFKEPQVFRNELFEKFFSLNCFGRIYLAQEGINAQMSVPEDNFEALKELLNSYPELQDMPFKIAVEDDGKSFNKLTIKVRNQIVADGLPHNEYDVTNVGAQLNAREWNSALEQGAIVIDVRNHYESEIGRFDNAIVPPVETFREELPWVLENLQGKENEKILLYCTGGVRCEKTSAYLKYHGFNDVNQLLGGIIDYARQVKEGNLENRFKGKNFVFDNRLGEQISCDVISQCHQCGAPCDAHVNCANKACNLLFIQCPSCAQMHDKCCSSVCNDVLDGVLHPSKMPKFGTNKRFFRSVAQ